MLWVDATQIRYMSDLGYLPRSSEWFLRDPGGRSVNGYLIPPARLEQVKQALARRNIYHHD